MKLPDRIKKLAVKILHVISGGKLKHLSPELVNRLENQEYLAKELRSLMQVEPWVIDFFQVIENEVEIRGWAIAPHGEPAKVSFWMNEQEFASIQYPQPRQDILDLFWYLPKPSDSGYTCRGVMPENANEDILFKYVRKETGQPLKPGDVYYYNHQRARKLPIPEAFRRTRVHGGDSEGTFLLEGYTTFRKLELALEQTLGRSYRDFPRILDWGCGCGRMARYFAELSDVSFTGVDIDADNAQWCQQNLGFGQFHAIPTHPPTALASSSFDLLIGISIFTHLREKEQFEWLDELRRIAANGAILLMTVHGNTTVGQANFTRPLLDTLKQHGFLDIGLNPNLNDVESIQTDIEYYRNTFHTRDYLLREWGKHFEIVNIIPGYIGNHQDLVILRK